MKPDKITALKNLWLTESEDYTSLQSPGIQLLDQIAELVSPGEHYFMVIDFTNLSVEYVSPSIENKLGIKPADASLEAVWKCIASEEEESLQKKEELTAHFFSEVVSPEDVAHYKAVYQLRLGNSDGNYVRYLHQSIPLAISDGGAIQRALIIHVDVQHLNIPSSDYVNFVGSDGRPSYYHIDPDKPEFKSAQNHPFSERELEIIAMIARGHTREEIADELSISPNTVATHRKNALRKSGCRTLNQLVATWVRKGLI